MAIDETLVVKLTPKQAAAAKAQAEADLSLWAVQKEQLDALKVSEMELRNKVVQYYFPAGLKEGTNKAELPEGWTLNVKGTINRKIDVATKDTVAAELKEKFEVDLGEFIKYKPDLELPQYRELVKQVQMIPADTPNPKLIKERKRLTAILNLVHQAMIITDGSPQVELVAPKKPKAKVSV